MPVTAPFPFRIFIEPRWSDLDEARMVNNATLMTYFEEARIRFLRQEIGWDFDQHGLVVAHASLDFRRPVTLADQPWVYLRVTQLGHKSIGLDCALAEDRDGEWRLFTEASFVLVAYDNAAKGSMPVPAHLRERLAGFLGQ
jgi:acyl-CoA thioester hydrolase